MVGAALGHAADQGAMPGGPDRRRARPTWPRMLGGKEKLFAISVIVLSAKLAKADGPVKRAEIDAFKPDVPHPAREPARGRPRCSTRRARTPRAGSPSPSSSARPSPTTSAMLEDVLAALFYIARADGPITRGEGAGAAGHPCCASAWMPRPGSAPRAARQRGISAQQIGRPTAYAGARPDARRDATRRSAPPGAS